MTKHPEKWVVPFLVFFFGYCLYVNQALSLSPDEAYYWYWSKHLDWSYVDHPPMVAYIMAFFTGFGGNSEFFVRFGGFLCIFFSFFFIALTTIRLFSNAPKLLWELLFIYSITLLFSAGAIIQTPETPMIFFWTIALYGGSRIITGGERKWWYLWGLALGFGLLSKYTMILLVPCHFGYILFSKEDRFWVTRKEPYLSLLLALLIFSPVLLWNFQHDWISFAFQLRQGFAPEGHSPIIKVLSYIGSQVAIITPLLFFSFFFYSLKGIRLSLRKEIATYRILLFYSWPILIFFAISSLFGEAAGANWPAPAYVAGLMVMWAVYYKHFRMFKGHRVFVTLGIALGLVVNLAIHLHIHHPYLPVSPQNDGLNQFRSWPQLGKDIEAAIQKHPHEAGYFLVSDKGTILAEAVFYTGNKYIGLNLFYPERYLFLKELDSLKGKNAIILARTQTAAALDRFHMYFEEVKDIGHYTHTYRGEEIPNLSVRIRLGERFLGNWPGRAQLVP
jgi:4-amino-4-deoxy-L-arabinose transferase-like glycosyltransferase